MTRASQVKHDISGGPSEAPRAVRVRLLGGFRVLVGLRSIEEGEWRLRKAASLVKLLALAPGHRLHRERLMELLWPTLAPRAAANNLHYALNRTRQTLEPDRRARASRYVPVLGEEILLCPSSPLWVDAETFEEFAATARRTRVPAAYRAALELYTGQLLPGDLYEEWAEGWREKLYREYLALLVELSTLLMKRKEFEPAIEALRRVLAQEPTYEEAHVGLMRLYALAGRRQDALGQYEQLKKVLSDEPGTRPKIGSRRLYEEIAAESLPPDHSPQKEEERLPEDPRDDARHNLPTAHTSFVGREGELAGLKRELATNWLVTLTGAGGCGKTRLALEVAKDFVAAYPDGVWRVDLVGLSEPRLVPQAVATALKVREQPNRPLTTTLVDALKSRRMLLVLDNCEHLIEACARLAEALLGSCAHLKILVTSREPLGLPAGETNWQVSSLTTPDPRQLPATESLTQYEAVRLFLDRTRSWQPSFALTSKNARAVAEISRKLEGVPLAIELAAARVRVLSAEQIAERLKDPIKLLTAGDRAADPRHRTLRGALDWSYELLTGLEKRLFERMSIFAGGWNLEAAEAVGAGDGIEEEDVLDLLSGLVNKSLVVAEASPGEEGARRYRMLEPVRQYGRERLEQSGEAGRLLTRHAKYHLVLAERAERELSGPDQAKWLDQLETEHDNLRAALSYLLGGEEAELGLRLAVPLWLFWYAHGHLNEGREWLEKSAFIGGARALHLKATALDGVGRLALFQGDYEAAKGLVEEALVLFRGLKDKKGIVSTLTLLGLVAMLGQQDLETVPALHEEAMSLRSEIEDSRTLAYLLLFSGIIAVGRSDWGQAETLHQESLALFREIRDILGTSVCLTNLGLMALDRRDHVRAAALFRENLRVVPESDKSATLHNLVGLACAASAQDQPIHAARLWGAAEAIQEAFAIRLTPMTWEGIYHDEHLSAARAQLNEAAWEAAWAEGKTMTTEQAVGYALSEKEHPPSATPALRDPPAGGQPSVLTRREQEVATLVARGLANRRIAEELSISEHTVATHVRNVLKKLGLDSRTQIATRVADRQ